MFQGPAASHPILPFHPPTHQPGATQILQGLGWAQKQHHLWSKALVKQEARLVPGGWSESPRGWSESPRGWSESPRAGQKAVGFISQFPLGNVVGIALSLSYQEPTSSWSRGRYDCPHLTKEKQAVCAEEWELLRPQTAGFAQGAGEWRASLFCWRSEAFPFTLEGERRVRKWDLW